MGNFFLMQLSSFQKIPASLRKIAQTDLQTQANFFFLSMCSFFKNLRTSLRGDSGVSNLTRLTFL